VVVYPGGGLSAGRARHPAPLVAVLRHFYKATDSSRAAQWPSLSSPSGRAHGRESFVGLSLNRFRKIWRSAVSSPPYGYRSRRHTSPIRTADLRYTTL
jgi:hypothetical protein